MNDLLRRQDNDRLRQVCEALGEPYSTPGVFRLEPDWVMTWERVLSIAEGRSAAWRELLTRAEEVDADWLNEWRRGRVRGGEGE